VEAVDHLRETKLRDFPPSSPFIALFVKGEPVYVLHRRDIERREAPQIAELLVEAFDRFCVSAAG
jgi:putative YphP/YqiW family bacilliredoxin